MKKLILSIAIIFSFIKSYSQDSISGCYSSNFAIIGWFGMHIRLNDDSTFNYLFSGDLFYDNTKGMYIQNKKEVILKFEKTTDTLEITLTDSLGNISRTRFPKPENPSANIRPSKLLFKRGVLLVYDENGSRIHRNMNAKGRRKKYYLVKHGPHEMKNW